MPVPPIRRAPHVTLAQSLLRPALRAGAAPYLPETTPLVVWRFGSLSLREGIASGGASTVRARGVGERSRLVGVHAVHALHEAASAGPLARVASDAPASYVRLTGRPLDA